ncbi:uncharacterized protein PHALS_00340 [Plasmopara halstedii]|uniref:Uncharacterized protein n=1 Tax=Plasmopara halstedii TaxID=4781 RepID=A0A0P1A765_PLAHL|nr:uncharacterized protein PHALS_00340 [Plasmopara halstedii]CEG36018.1 hypothetical protein PHALS_00340 [Plasmopara halstedii]|eukprot:XP_024572387.1 hypothetical protein PHALS_00340 [Plasmopara halstedii]
MHIGLTTKPDVKSSNAAEAKSLPSSIAAVTRLRIDMSAFSYNGPSYTPARPKKSFSL